MRGFARTSIYAATIAASLLVPVLSGPIGTVANADPGEDQVSSDRTTLSLGSVGLDSNLALYGLQGTQALTIPVSPGLAPSTLNALVELPVGVRGGTIALSQDDRTLARVPLPTDFDAPVSIPLDGANVVDNAITVLVRSYLDPLDGYCLYDPTVPLRLADPSLSFAGAEIPPTTVADFLPPVLRKLTLFVPPSPSRGESDAAVRMATAVVARYGKQATEIVVAPLAAQDPVPAVDPFERQIIIREGPNVGVSLQGLDGVRPLLVTGQGGALANQSRLLSSDMARLALSSKAVAGPLKNVPQLPADQTTLLALGQPGVTAIALSPQVSLAMDQTRLGRPAHNVRVHLRGSYTPPPSGIGGQLVATIGGQTIDSWPLDPSGAIDRWVSIPDNLLVRYTSLVVALNITGNTGRCGEFQPLTLTIDGDSAVESAAAKPPVPSGFQSLPQALLPRVSVGIGADGFADTVRAVTIMAGLQRLSALPMDTAVMSVEDAVNAKEPAVLIAAGNWTDDRISLPVANAGGGELRLTGGSGSETQTVTLDPAIEYGSLQTVYTGDRTVLIATSTDAREQLDALLGWLNADSRRWSKLSGDALLSAPGRDPITVDANLPVPQENPTLQSGWPSPWWIAAAGGAGVLVALALLAVRLRHRARS
jgi:hypothetical protein